MIKDGEVSCGVCGHSGGIHLYAVDVYERGAEDSENGMHVRVGTNVLIDSNLDGNPSARRGGVVLSFWCELCGGGRSQILIAQHKGSEQVTFRGLKGSYYENE